LEYVTPAFGLVLLLELLHPNRQNHMVSNCTGILQVRVYYKNMLFPAKLFITEVGTLEKITKQYAHAFARVVALAIIPLPYSSALAIIPLPYSSCMLPHDC